MFFKINQPLPKPTPREALLAERESPAVRRDRAWLAVETLGLFATFMLWGGWIPAVNETHYLARGKGFWDASWCPGDLFVHAAVAHGTFYLLFGWITQFLSLPATALVGRIAAASLLAIGWSRLAWTIRPRPGVALVSGWIFLLLNSRFHLAGEWVVGGVEAKCFAWFFVLLALRELVVRNNARTALWLGAATACHLLVGGWAIAAWGVVGIAGFLFQLPGPASTERRWSLSRGEWAGWIGGALLALFGLVPPLVANSGSDWSTTVLASEIYVQRRIFHHLDFDQFKTGRIARFALLITLWLFLWRLFIRDIRLRRLNWFAAGSLLIGLTGLGLSAVAGSQTGSGHDLAVVLLRLYWFRLGDGAVPLATSLMLVSLVWHLGWRSRLQRPRLAAIAFVGLIGLAVSLSVAESLMDPRPAADARSLPQYPDNPRRTVQTWENWVAVCKWISRNTPSDARFLTPAQQQTFKWYAGRTEIVNWKDIPQSDLGILDWWERVEQLGLPQQRWDLGLLAYSDEQLRDLARRYQIDYLVLPQSQYEQLGGSTSFQLVYPETPEARRTYVVLKLSNDDDPSSD